MGPPVVQTVVQETVPAWIKWVLALLGLALIGAFIWCFMLSQTVNRLERHNTELVRWTREVQTWSESVSAALWGPGGDPCCIPPKPPPELQ